jgi:hypothetical protein
LTVQVTLEATRDRRTQGARQVVRPPHAPTVASSPQLWKLGWSIARTTAEAITKANTTASKYLVAGEGTQRHKATGERK